MIISRSIHVAANDIKTSHITASLLRPEVRKLALLIIAQEVTLSSVYLRMHLMRVAQKASQACPGSSRGLYGTEAGVPRLPQASHFPLPRSTNLRLCSFILWLKLNVHMTRRLLHRNLRLGRVEEKWQRECPCFKVELAGRLPTPPNLLLAGCSCFKFSAPQPEGAGLPPSALSCCRVSWHSVLGCSRSRGAEPGRTCRLRSRADLPLGLHLKAPFEAHG